MIYNIGLPGLSVSIDHPLTFMEYDTLRGMGWDLFAPAYIPEIAFTALIAYFDRVPYRDAEKRVKAISVSSNEWKAISDDIFHWLSSSPLYCTITHKKELIASKRFHKDGYVRSGVLNMFDGFYSTEKIVTDTARLVRVPAAGVTALINVDATKPLEFEDLYNRAATASAKDTEKYQQLIVSWLQLPRKEIKNIEVVNTTNLARFPYQANSAIKIYCLVWCFDMFVRCRFTFVKGPHVYAETIDDGRLAGIFSDWKMNSNERFEADKLEGKPYRR